MLCIGFRHVACILIITLYLLLASNPLTEYTLNIYPLLQFQLNNLKCVAGFSD